MLTLSVLIFSQGRFQSDNMKLSEITSYVVAGSSFPYHALVYHFKMMNY